MLFRSDAKGNVVDAKGTLHTAATAGATRVDGVLALVTAEDGTYYFDNLPTAYVSEDDQHYLAAYRLELADVEHKENTDGSDNQWLLTRYHTDETTDRELDSDAADVTAKGIAGGMVIGGSFEEGGIQTRANDGQVILAQERVLPAGAITNADGCVSLPAGQAMDTLGGRVYDWTKAARGTDVFGNADVATVRGGDVGETQAPIQKITGQLWFDDSNDGIRDASEDLAAGLDVTLERYYTLATLNADGTFTLPADVQWLRDDEWNAADGAKSTWASAAQWEAYDKDPAVGLGDDNPAGSASAADADVPRTVATDADGTYTFPNLMSQEWVGSGADRKLVVYAYKARVTDLEDRKSVV